VHVAMKDWKGWYMIFIDNQVAWDMLQVQNLHRVVEKIRA